MFTASVARIPVGTAGLMLIGLALTQSARHSQAQTLDAQPDLQGLWAYTAETPLQRPESLGDQRVYSQADLAVLENQLWRSAAGVGLSSGSGFGALALAQVNGEYRTSLIIAPADGRIPYRQGRELTTGDAQASTLPRGPEALPIQRRCLGPPAQLPLLAPRTGESLAQRSIRIIQTDEYVAIQQPFYNALRIIKLNGRYLPFGGGQWLGDSHGIFDANSLVVNTGDFRPQQSNTVVRSSPQMQVYERFTPLADGRLLYTYTIFDPVNYTEPFIVEMPLERLPEDQALRPRHCHEDNFGLPAALISARQRELREQLNTSRSTDSDH